MNELVKIKIETNEISIKNNNLPAGSFKIYPAFSRKTGHIKDSKYFTEITMEIKNTKDNPFPVDIHIRMTCIFDVANLQEDQIDKMLKIQGMVTLIPYIRATVSSLTALSMLPPIVLPIMDTLDIFPEDRALIESLDEKNFDMTDS